MRSQSPQQLRYFELIIQRGKKQETKYLWATSKDNAISQANKILKYTPGPPGKVVAAKEVT